MAEDKKISQLGQLTTIGGDELFVVASEGENYSVKSSTIKSYAQQGVVKEVAGKGLSSNDYATADKNAVATIGNKVDKVEGKGLSTNDYTDEDKAKLASLSSSSDNTAALAGKLDKQVWDDEHKQFSLQGYWHVTNKNISTSADYVRTPLIAINHDCDITVTSMGTHIVAAIMWFDANGKPMSGGIPSVGSGEVAKLTTKTVAAADIPDGAVYFSASTFIQRVSESSWTNGPTLESREGATSEAIQASKLNLFVDLWTKGYDCTYDATKTKPFKCNKVELTYEEAIAVYNAPRITYNQPVGFTSLIGNPKTIILGSFFTRFGVPDLYASFNGMSFVTLRFAQGDQSPIYMRNLRQTFSSCANLKEIIGALHVGPITDNTNIYNIFESCAALEIVYLRELKVSISFQDSPLISLASLQYLVTNAANTSAITVTVHPTTYAKLTDTSNTQWHTVLTSAASKNISFATT